MRKKRKSPQANNNNGQSTGKPGSWFPALRRPFKIIVFDWDGTAVMSRNEDASEVGLLLAQLLRSGVIIVIVTGTNLENIERQLGATIQGTEKQNLFICTNRGSEVFGYESALRPTLVWKREATDEENWLLTDIAETVKSQLKARTGLEIRVIYDRLNRRKIDLIALPEWKDPPKSSIGDLIKAVEKRLIDAGLRKGLLGAIRLAETTAKEKGLPNARITSDVKHIEVGLTDKGDSIKWIIDSLAKERGIPNEEILIVGDEFGPVAGFPGSDFKMVVPEAKGAVFASVGKEPGGTPAEVLFLGGGPDRFKQLLKEQLQVIQQENAGRKGSQEESVNPRKAELNNQRSTPDPLPTMTIETLATNPFVLSEPDWLLVEEGFEPSREHEIESLFAIANGYVGTRGTFTENSSVSRPSTFVAGVYDRSVDLHSNDDPTPAPNWAHMRILVDGERLRIEDGETLEHRRILDLKRGLLIREWRQRDRNNRVIRLRFVRFASLADRHVLYESVEITPENFTGEVTVESLIDAVIPSLGGKPATMAAPPTRAADVEFKIIDEEKFPVLTFNSQGYNTEVSFATANIIETEEATGLERSPLIEDSLIGERLQWKAEVGLTYNVAKLVTVFTSRESSKPVQAAPVYLRKLLVGGTRQIIEDHVSAWDKRWKTSDIEVGNDEESQLALRFALYHLISSANPLDERVSIGARGLTGRAYRGHVFWDTDIYMLPFYIYTHPPSARALLMYRYHTLNAAKARAKNMGFSGALFAWESAVTGEDLTPPFVLTPKGEVVFVYSGLREHHISADVAYAVWHYWQATKDVQFLQEAGAEVLIETARFWASRVSKGNDDLYHINGVMGPDEYHEKVDDNAYTNMMAGFNLDCAARAVAFYRINWPENWLILARRLEIQEQEMSDWIEISGKMYTGFNPATGLIEQFRGYFDLPFVNLAEYEPRSSPMDVILGHEEVEKTQIIKQPDVVLLLYLLWDSFPPDVREANFRFYEPRTGHGSSLSPSICSLVAARIGDLSLAEKYLRQAGEIDLANNMGNAAFGVHMGALGGLWQAVIFGIGGLQLQQEGLVLNPRLPETWKFLEFSAGWQGRIIKAKVDKAPPSVEVELEGNPMVLVLGDHVGKILQPGEKQRSTLIGNVWGPWEKLEE